MQNFPKLSSTFQDTEFPFQLNKNQHQTIEECESRKITTASQGRNLSPFTWSNIKLPTVLIKDKLQKSHKINEKDERKQQLPKKLLNKNEIIEATILETIGQKAKKALNISLQLKRMLPQKVSPLKNLHEKVLVDYEKRKLTTGLKMRQNRSFTQKQVQKILAKTYETMEVKANDKLDIRQVGNHLLRTEQRYRNPKYLHYDSGIKKEEDKKQDDRYSKSGASGVNDMASFRAKHKESRKSSNEKYLINDINNSIVVKSSLNSVSKNVHSHSINQQMQPYIRRYFTKLAHQNDNRMPKIFVTTNPKYHPLHMNEHNTSAFDAKHDSSHKTLIWTKTQSLNIFRQKTSDQYYNHVEGSYVLTSKEKLHEILNGGKGYEKTFYPISFSFPKQYNDFIQEYDWVMVKTCLKFLIKEIRKFQKGVMTQSAQNSIPDNASNDSNNFSVCLSDILQDLTRETKNEPQLKLLKFCLFLQSGRKKERLDNFFEKIKNYRSVDINLSESIYIDIIDWCLELMKLSKQNLQQNEQARNIIANSLELENVDYRLIQLLKAYDYLFLAYLPAYLYRTLSSSHNSWLIKPFASSKAAGISLIIKSSQFYTTPDYEYKQYRHRSKYHNKIFMKYIENPLLIKHSGMDYFVQKNIKDLKKELQKDQSNQDLYENLVTEMNHKVARFLTLQEKFCGRKFDVRQWVMIVCDQHTEGNFENNDKMMGNNPYEGRKSPKSPKSVKRTKIYKYHTAYCRFAQKQYSLDNTDPQVHLTNYEMYKKSPLKTDRKSPSITKENESEEKGRTRKRLGSMVKEEKDSVFMLNELFEYIDFITEIKQKKTFVKNQKNKGSISLIKEKYESQLDMILQSVFEASYSHLTHHRGTFELFGVDLLMDEDMNMYLLEVNLNPGCSSQREEKLSQQSQVMLETMFQTIMCSEDEQELQELKHRRIEKMNQKVTGSRQFIGDSELQIDDKEQGQEIKQATEQKNDGKEIKRQRKWILVGEKETH